MSNTHSEASFWSWISLRKWRDELFAHPESVGETYAQHFRVALAISGQALWISAAAAVHAIVPGFCTTTASDAIEELNSGLRSRRQMGIGDDGTGDSAELRISKGRVNR